MKALKAIVTTCLAIGAAPVLAEDWTGAYAGFSFGYADVDGPNGSGGDDTTFGPHVGYDYDFGNFVLGGELEYNRLSLDLGQGEGSVDSLTRLSFSKGGEFPRAPDISRCEDMSEGPRDRAPFLLVRFLMWPPVNKLFAL